MKKWNKKLFCILAIVFFAQFCKSYAVRFNNVPEFLEKLYTQLVLFVGGASSSSMKAFFDIMDRVDSRHCGTLVEGLGDNKNSAYEPADDVYEELFYPSGTLVEGLGDNRNATPGSTLMERKEFVEQLFMTFLNLKHQILGTNSFQLRQAYSVMWSFFLNTFIEQCNDPGPWKELIDANEMSLDRFMKLHLDNSLFVAPPSFSAEDNGEPATGLTEIYLELRIKLESRPNSGPDSGPNACTSDFGEELF